MKNQCQHWLFEGAYADRGRESIPPERLIRVQLLQVLFSIRSNEANFHGEKCSNRTQPAVMHCWPIFHDKRPGGSAINGRTSQHVSYEINQRSRKRVEEPFGWVKTVGLIGQIKVRGLSKVNSVFMMTMIGWNLTRIRSLLE